MKAFMKIQSQTLKMKLSLYVSFESFSEFM